MLSAPCAGEGPLQEVAVIHTLAEVPGSRLLLQHNTTQDSAAELFEGGSLADVAAAASAASHLFGEACTQHHEHDIRTVLSSRVGRSHHNLPG